jgi:squalene-associated FAD-dependent desaturase
VIGGGFAGLAAAVALAQADVRVHVVEARPTLGGRANTFRDPATGERVDNGQHVLAGCYDETLTFLRRIGTADRLHRPSTLRVPMLDERGRRTELVFPPLPSPLNVLAGVLAWDAISLGERLAVLRAGDALREGGAVLPGETVHQWLVRHHQSARLCRLFWEPLALAALNQSIDHAAADVFVAVTSRMFSAQDGSVLLVPAVPLDELYVSRSIEFLMARGALVQAQAKAAAVIEGERVTGVSLHGQLIPASTVVCAVPWFALADVFPHPPHSLEAVVSSASRLESAPIVTVNLWFDAWRLSEQMLGLPGRSFQWAFDRRTFVKGGQTHVSLISSGADAICAMTNQALIELALHELREALPETAAARLRHAAVIRERRATFSLRPGGPPRPPTTTAVKGLFLAGDWIATGLPATIESAVLSGHRAASNALMYLRCTQ